MKYYIKQKGFSIGDRFDIKNEYGYDCFYVQGEVFSFGKKLHMYYSNGVEAAFIKRRVFTFLPKYEVYVNGRLAMEIIKEFTMFRQCYSIRALGWQVTGDFFAHEYVINRAEQSVAHISKQWFTWGDSYQINILSGVFDIYVLAVVLTIDITMSQN